MPILGFSERAVDMIDDLFPEIFEVVIEFLEGIVSLLFLTFEHHISLLLEFTFTSVELFLTLSSGFLILLVLLVTSVEVEIRVV